MMIYFVTANKNKLREMESILELKLKHINLDLDEIQAVEVRKVVEHKTKKAFQKIRKPVLVEDTGLYFKAWNGLPGALIKWFDLTLGYKELCQLLGKSRQARAQTVIGYFDGKRYKDFIGEIKGSIAKNPKGKRGFGWDSIFIAQIHKKTFAQMTPEEKNNISMRKIAALKLKNFLKQKQLLLK